MATLSGAEWCAKFPGSSSVDDLKDPFRGAAKNFLSALEKAGASVSISATYRPPERAFLMHYCVLVAEGAIDPSAVPAMTGVEIDWVHKDAGMSRQAAKEMAAGYGIVYPAALVSRHTEGNAIDMSISWTGGLTIQRADSSIITITSAPRSGGNRDLHLVGAGYGVIKLATDPPHWSSDGH